MLRKNKKEKISKNLKKLKESILSCQCYLKLSREKRRETKKTKKINKLSTKKNKSRIKELEIDRSSLKPKLDNCERTTPKSQIQIKLPHQKSPSIVHQLSLLNNLNQLLRKENFPILQFKWKNFNQNRIQEQTVSKKQGSSNMKEAIASQKKGNI